MNDGVTVYRLRIGCNSLRLRGAGFLGVGGQQFHGHTRGGRYPGFHVPLGVGSVQCVQLGLGGVELLGLGFQIVVIGIFCTLTGQAVSNDAVYFVLREGAGLLLHSGCSGNGFLMHSFVHGCVLSRPVPRPCTVYIHPHPPPLGMIGRSEKALWKNRCVYFNPTPSKGDLQNFPVCKSALDGTGSPGSRGGGPSPPHARPCANNDLSGKNYSKAARLRLKSKA